jgi:hypothetical protein
MHEQCNDQVSVLASFTPGPRGLMRVVPHVMKWQGKRWRVDTMGLYHPERRGTKRVHVFGFSSGTTAFRLELDPDTLQWTLVEVFYG